MWTIAAVNKKFKGPLGSYNGLTDVHLAHFFSQPSRQSHLKAAKLITEDGFIVPEKNVKGELHLHEKKRKVYDILASSILQSAVHEEGSWNKKLCNYLEDISKMTAVDKARKTMKKKSNKVASEFYLEQPFYNVACGNDVFRSPVKSADSYRNVLRPPNSAPDTCVYFTKDGQQKFSKLKLTLSAKQYSPYGMPLMLSGSYKEQIQSFFDSNKTVKQKKRKWRKLNNSIGNSNAVKDNNFPDSFIKVSVPYQTLKVNQCQITMLYHGHLHLTNFQKALTQNIIIKQQHCGGTPVVLYKGNISANEFLSFFILDHEGFFFSLTVFVNGIRELKLSSCCVFRYLPGRRLGGPNGTFSMKKIEGGKQCLKCQYQEYESNEFKVHSQSSRNSVDALVNVENSHAPQLVIKNASGDEVLLDNLKPPSPTESDIQLNDESQKVTDIESHPDDEIEEILDEGKNQDIIQEVSPESSIADEKIDSSYEDEAIEDHDSDSTVSFLDQSEVSEQYTIDEQTKYPSVDTSSSEDEGENHHIVMASIHKIPEDG